MAAPKDEPGTVYIGGSPCNRACRSYIAWSRKVSSELALRLTKAGERFFSALGIDVDAAANGRRPLCRACLDWSERRHHLAGTLGAAVMNRFTELNWAARDSAPGSRVVNFTRTGEKRFAALFGATAET